MPAVKFRKSPKHSPRPGKKTPTDRGHMWAYMDSVPKRREDAAYLRRAVLARAMYRFTSGDWANHYRQYERRHGTRGWCVNYGHLLTEE